MAKKTKTSKRFNLSATGSMSHLLTCRIVDPQYTPEQIVWLLWENKAYTSPGCQNIRLTEGHKIIAVVEATEVLEDEYEDFGVNDRYILKAA